MKKGFFFLLVTLIFSACDNEYISKKREGMTWFSQDDEAKEAQEEQQK